MLLEVRDLKTYFETRRGPVKAVDGISYDVAVGEMVALVGESGCGKTVSSLSLLRLLPEPPAKIRGEAFFDGRDLLKLDNEEIRNIRGRRISVVFQEPMTCLNPVLTIGRQLTESLVEHKLMDWEQARKEASRLLGTVGITDAESRLMQYPDQFSGGMRQRMMFAMAISCSPSLIIADEPTTAVDVTIQAQLLELLNDLMQRFELAILLITHNMGIVAQYAQRINVMYAGRIVEQAPTEELFRNPMHPYTQALLSCIPRLDRGRQARLNPIEGQPPDLVDRPLGCAFHPRCSVARPECREKWPPLMTISDGHLVACDYRREGVAK